MVILFDREQNRIRIYVGVPELGAIGDREPLSQRGKRVIPLSVNAFERKARQAFQAIERGRCWLGQWKGE